MFRNVKGCDSQIFLLDLGITIVLKVLALMNTKPSSKGIRHYITVYVRFRTLSSM